MQWISIFLLVLGVVSSQMTWMSTSSSNDQDLLIVHHKNSKHSEHHHLSAGSRQLLALIRDSQHLLDPSLSMHSVTKIVDSSSDSSSSSSTEHHDDLTSSMETVVFGHFNIPKECWGVLLCCSSAFLVACANVFCEWMYVLSNHAKHSKHTQCSNIDTGTNENFRQVFTIRMYDSTLSRL